MKNSRNKIMAAAICGVIMGSVGTSIIGNFQGSNNAVSSATSSENDSSSKDSSTNSVTSTSNSSSNSEYASSNPNPSQKKPSGGKGGHHSGAGSLEAGESVDVSSGEYTDGTYEGSASGYAQGLKVEVQISNGKITDVEIISHNETPGFYETAFEVVPQEIIQAQSTDVDTVSRATYSSVGIINAVNDALSQAKK